jgi:sulfonate transport system permease protein
MTKHAAQYGVLGSTGGRTMVPTLVVGVLLILWQLVARTGIINPLLLPAPLSVLLAARDIGPALGFHLAATVTRIVTGFVLGACLGTGIGLSMQYSRRVFLLLDGIVETSRPIPPVALVPFFLLVFGFAESGKILLVTVGTSLIMVVATVEAIERVPAGILRWGLVLGLPRRTLFRRIILPAAIPELRTGLRVALAVSVTLVIVSEFMGATYGLGYLINVAKVTLTTPTLVLSVILLGWVSWGLDQIVRAIFDRVSAWDLRAKGALK